MADMSVGDIVEVRFNGRCFEQEVMLTHHYRTVAVPGGTQVQVGCNHLIQALTTVGIGGDLLQSAYLACLPPQYTLTSVDAQIVSPARYAYERVPFNAPGTNGDNADTANLAAVITMRTERAGRRQVSNKHIGPIPTNAPVFVNGSLVIGYKNTLEVLGANLATGAVFTPLLELWQPVIYHKDLVWPNNYNAVGPHTVQETVRTERRRNIGIGV